MTPQSAAYLRAFERVRQEFTPAFSKAGLRCEVGYWLESAALKVFKPAWGSGRAEPNRINAELFFTLWILDQPKVPNRIQYSIHALRLWKKKTHAIQSSEFARAFRREFVADQRIWPNVSIDFGPTNLMQGWIDVAGPEGDLAKVQALLKNIKPLASLIDRLLEERML